MAGSTGAVTTEAATIIAASMVATSMPQRASMAERASMAAEVAFMGVGAAAAVNLHFPISFAN